MVTIHDQHQHQHPSIILILPISSYLIELFILSNWLTLFFFYISGLFLAQYIIVATLNVPSEVCGQKLPETGSPDYYSQSGRDLPIFNIRSLIDSLF